MSWWLLNISAPARRLNAALAILCLTHAYSFSYATSANQPSQLLSQTGLYIQGTRLQIAPGVMSYTPQYSLWSDGASKRRWVYLPPGKAIGGRLPDAWDFPVGTKFWKEFALRERVETRLIERLHDGKWRYAVYVWRADGSDAELAPVAGLRAHPVRDAPNGKYVIPSQNDCRTCHEGAAVPILGFSALQLSPDRDPKAPNAEAQGLNDVDLRILVQRKLLHHSPKTLLNPPPRIKAATATERAVLGYLHANCGHCHNDPQQSEAGIPVELLFAQYVARPDASDSVLKSLATLDRVELLLERMRTRDPLVQMPPLATQVPDYAALSLIEFWIQRELNLSTRTQANQ